MLGLITGLNIITFTIQCDFMCYLEQWRNAVEELKSREVGRMHLRTMHE